MVDSVFRQYCGRSSQNLLRLDLELVSELLDNGSVYFIESTHPFIAADGGDFGTRQAGQIDGVFNRIVVVVGTSYREKNGGNVQRTLLI